MLTLRPKKVSEAMAGVFESKGSSLGLTARNSKLPSISSHLFSERHGDIESGDLRRWNTTVHGSLFKVEVQAPRPRVPSAGFLPNTLYVAEAKRPFGGARNLKPTVL
jgi:hypothetical protein